MIGKILTIATATVVSAVAVAGAICLVALDLAGAPMIERAWSFLTKPRETSPIEDRLAGTKDLTFFKTVRVDSRPYAITMGVSFATPEDLATGKQKLRWCYCTIKPKDGGLPRQIELAAQEGKKPPRYHDLSSFSASELALLGETIESLATVARKHCVFTKEPGGPGSLVRRFTTIVLKGEKGEGSPS